MLYFDQKPVSAPTLLNSRTYGKTEFFLDVEELTFLILYWQGSSYIKKSI